MKDNLKKIKKKARGAGISTITLGGFYLFVSFALIMLWRELFGDEMAAIPIVALTVIAGLILIVLGIGVLRKGTICLGIAIVIASLMMVLIVFSQIASGFFSVYTIFSILIHIIVIVSMVKGFAPIKYLKQVGPNTAKQLTSSESRLKELESLRKKGMISEEEYKAKRKEVIHKL